MTDIANYMFGGATLRFWAKVALPDENGCMLWLASLDRHGYGRFQVGPKNKERAFPASRVSLFVAEGAPPTDGMHAAHSCRNKHCVAPAHLRWATRAQNEADKLADGVSNRGTRHGMCKLTPEQVLAIRDRYAKTGIGKRELGAEYGVTQYQIHSIVTRKTWAWLEDGVA
jgi:hypothetical protein